MRVKLQIKGKQFPQTAIISDENLQKIIDGRRVVEWFNEYKTKAGVEVKHRHLTINEADAIITDIEVMDESDQDINLDGIPE